MSKRAKLIWFLRDKLRAQRALLVLWFPILLTSVIYYFLVTRGVLPKLGMMHQTLWQCVKVATGYSLITWAAVLIIYSKRKMLHHALTTPPIHHPTVLNNAPAAHLGNQYLQGDSTDIHRLIETHLSHIHKTHNKVLLFGDNLWIIGRGYNPKTHPRFNPKLKEYPGWNIFKDVTSLSECDLILNHLLEPIMPTNTIESFLTKRYLSYLLLDRSLQPKAILRLLREFSAQDFRDRLSCYSLAFHHKQGCNLIKCIQDASELLCGLNIHEGGFSLRDWLLSPQNQAKQLSLDDVVTGSPTIIAAEQAWLQLALSIIANHKSDTKQPVWVVINALEEVENIQPLIHLLNHPISILAGLTISCHDPKKAHEKFGEQTLNQLMQLCQSQLVLPQIRKPLVLKQINEHVCSPELLNIKHPFLFTTYSDETVCRYFDQYERTRIQLSQHHQPHSQQIRIEA